MEGQTGHNCTTGVKQLLVSGDCETCSTAILVLYCGDMRVYIANYSKENGVGRGHAPYGVIKADKLYTDGIVVLQAITVCRRCNHLNWLQWEICQYCLDVLTS